jgi:predicted nucleotidyltransferase
MEIPVDVEELRKVLRAHGVVFALIFGSFAAGAAKEGSDVDLAVWSRGPIDTWRLGGELSQRIDLLDLSRAPETLAGQVALEGKVILDDHPIDRIRWQADTRKRYLDEHFRREQFRQDFVKSHG